MAVARAILGFSCYSRGRLVVLGAVALLAGTIASRAPVGRGEDAQATGRAPAIASTREDSDLDLRAIRADIEAQLSDPSRIWAGEPTEDPGGRYARYGKMSQPDRPISNEQ